MEVVRKLNRSSPYFTNQIFSVGTLNVNVFLCALVKCISQSPNAWLNNRNVLVFFDDCPQSIEWKLLSINRKGLELMHVVDIRPDGVKRNTV